MVSAYLHALFDGEPNYVTLPKGTNVPQGKVQQLFKALNGTDQVGQLWRTHYDN